MRLSAGRFCCFVTPLSIRSMLCARQKQKSGQSPAGQRKKSGNGFAHEDEDL